MEATRSVIPDTRRRPPDGRGLARGRSDTRTIWVALDQLVDRAPSLEDLREHRLQLFAATRWARTGRGVPSELRAEATLAAILSLPVRSLLGRIAAAWDGPAIVIKGPEVAALYPDGVPRPAGDIDVLVEDSPSAHAALRAAGFVVTGDPRRYADIHHLQPLVWPQLPVRIELHHAPKWIDGLKPPSAAELFAHTVPARGDAEGFLALTPEAHAIVLAVHSWAHEPLGRLRDLLDIALVSVEADPAATEQLARAWGVLGVWRTTSRTVEALFGGAGRPLALRLWGRHLETAAGRTVAGSHLEAWLSNYWALPGATAFRETLRRIARESRPIPGEGWRTKFARAALALRDARTRRSTHERMLEGAGLATPPALLLDRVARRRSKAGPRNGDCANGGQR